MVDLDTVRRFAGADPTVEDLALEMCRDAAAAWYEAAGVPTDTDSRLYDFWVCNLAAWMYDNRGNADAGANIPAFIVASVHQLRPKRTAAGTASGTGTGTGTETETGTETGTGTGEAGGTDDGDGTGTGEASGTGEDGGTGEDSGTGSTGAGEGG